MSQFFTHKTRMLPLTAPFSPGLAVVVADLGALVAVRIVSAGLAFVKPFPLLTERRHGESRVAVLKLAIDIPDGEHDIASVIGRWLELESRLKILLAQNVEGRAVGVGCGGNLTQKRQCDGWFVRLRLAVDSSLARFDSNHEADARSRETRVKFSLWPIIPAPPVSFFRFTDITLV